MQVFKQISKGSISNIKLNLQSPTRINIPNLFQMNFYYPQQPQPYRDQSPLQDLSPLSCVDAYALANIEMFDEFMPLDEKSAYSEQERRDVYEREQIPISN